MQFTASAPAVFGGIKKRDYPASDDGKFDKGVSVSALFMTPDDGEDPWIIVKVRPKDQAAMLPFLDKLSLGATVDITVDNQKFRPNDLPTLKGVSHREPGK